MIEGRAKAAAVLAVLLLSFVVFSTSVIFASTPSSGTITPTNPTTLWTGSTTTSNPTVGLATSFDPSTCQTLGYCDLFVLNLNIPSNLGSSYPDYFLNTSISWANPNYDYDLYVYYNGTLVGSGTLGTGTSYENVFIHNPRPGSYDIYADSWLVPPETLYNANATLGLTLPPYSFPTRSATYFSDAAKSTGAPYVITPDLRLVGAQSGGCGPDNTGTGLCNQDVEPSIKVDQFGTIYASAINGVPAGTDFWRSTDGGNSFQYLGEPDGAQSSTASTVTMGGLGGGDDDLALGSPYVLLNQSSNVVLNSTGNVYESSLWLGGVTVSSSIDQGNNWVVSQTPVPAADRQWTAASGPLNYYVSYNELVSEVAGVTNLVALQSVDGGITFANGAYIGKAVGGNLSTFQGPIELGPDGTLYAIFVPPATNQLMLAKCPGPCNLPPLPLSTTSSPFHVSRIFNGPTNMTTDNVFPQLAVDSAGNLYVAWSDGRNVYMIASSDGGATWTLPVKVNYGQETATALEPWIQAGDSGRVGLMWYGTNVTSDSPDNFTAYANAQWKVFYSFTPDALSSGPTFYQVVASGGSDLPNGVVHVGAICTEGTACPSGTRNLAEYSSFTVGPDGNIYMVFSEDKNTTSQGGAAQTDFVKETFGPSFFTPSPGSARGVGAIQGTAGKLDHFNFKIASTGTGVTGSLKYLDQGNSVMVTSTAISTFTISGDHAAFTGAATYTNGRVSEAVTFTVSVTGNQASGSEDVFSISLSNGYSASGFLLNGKITVTSG